MDTFLILFRGINVGGRNLLPMKSLVSVLEQNNYHNVTTYIQTGNVILQSNKIPDDLSYLVETNFGFTPEVLVLTKDDFSRSVLNNPYTEFPGKEVHLYFCKELPTHNIEKINTVKSATENYQLIDKTFYLHAPDGIGRSKLVANLEKCLGVAATGRNLNTVNKLITLLDTV